MISSKRNHKVEENKTKQNPYRKTQNKHISKENRKRNCPKSISTTKRKKKL